MAVDLVATSTATIPTLHHTRIQHLYNDNLTNLLIPIFTPISCFTGGFLTTLGAVGDAVGNVAFLGLSFAAMNALKNSC